MNSNKTLGSTTDKLLESVHFKMVPPADLGIRSGCDSLIFTDIGLILNVEVAKKYSQHKRWAWVIAAPSILNLRWSLGKTPAWKAGGDMHAFNKC